jgi:hypothetical protein
MAFVGKERKQTDGLGENWISIGIIMAFIPVVNIICAFAFIDEIRTYMIKSWQIYKSIPKK